MAFMKTLWPLAAGLGGLIAAPFLGISVGTGLIIGGGLATCGYTLKGINTVRHNREERNPANVFDTVNRARTQSIDEIGRLRHGDAAAVHELEAVSHASQNPEVRNEISQSLAVSRQRSDLMNNLQRAMNLCASSLQKKDLKKAKEYFDYLRKVSKSMTGVYDQQIKHGDRAIAIIDQQIRQEAIEGDKQKLVELAAEKERVKRARDISRMQRREASAKIFSVTWNNFGRVLGRITGFVAQGFDWLGNKIDKKVAAAGEGKKAVSHEPSETSAKQEHGMAIVPSGNGQQSESPLTLRGFDDEPEDKAA